MVPENRSVREVRESHGVPQADIMPDRRRPARSGVAASEGQPLEIRVSWWPVTLWFVPDVRHAEALRREGIARERIWTASELIVLLEAPPPTTEALRVITIARREFGGEVVEVRAPMHDGKPT